MVFKDILRTFSHVEPARFSVRLCREDAGFVCEMKVLKLFAPAEQIDVFVPAHPIEIHKLHLRPILADEDISGGIIKRVKATLMELRCEEPQSGIDSLLIADLPQGIGIGRMFGDVVAIA